MRFSLSHYSRYFKKPKTPEISEVLGCLTRKGGLIKNLLATNYGPTRYNGALLSVFTAKLVLVQATAPVVIFDAVAHVKVPT